MITVYYSINNNTLNAAGSNQRFVDIINDPSFTNITTDPGGRIGKRFREDTNNYALPNHKYTINLTTDISLNYQDPSWNFYAALDTSSNAMKGAVWTIVNGSLSQRPAIVHIYDISYNSRYDGNGNIYVPKFYDVSGGGNNFNNIDFQYTFSDDPSNNNSSLSNNSFGGFTYTPRLYDSTEVLPNTGGGGGGGTDPSGGGGAVDPSGGRDSSGNNVADNSQNIYIIDNSLNLWFFDPPKAITNGNIEINTQTPPRLDASWNNPLQTRVAFDFLGNSGPAADLSGIGTNNPYTRDDYNYLPYFQGISAEFVCLKADGTLWGNGRESWREIPHSSMDGLPGSQGADYWRDKPFLPRFIKKFFIYASSSGGASPYLNNGRVYFPNYSGLGPERASGYEFALPSTFGGANTSGCRVQLRVAMVNRAHATINDPSYASHFVSSPGDVSWNWVYLPDISGIGIGTYGAPTPPLTFQEPTGSNNQYDQLLFSGQNDNAGTGTQPSDANAGSAVVETGLFTPFSSLTVTGQLPKVQYRYDISGHRLPNGANLATQSQQIGGYGSKSSDPPIDISRNLPDTDVSANWYPTNSNTTANTWTDTIPRGLGSTGIYPQHKYEVTRYSMRYNLDPSGVTGKYRDASSNAVVSAINTWITPPPTRNEVTKTDSNGYNNTLLDNDDTTTSWIDAIGGNWTQNNYKTIAGKGWENTYQTQENLLFLNNGLESGVAANTIKLTPSFTYNLKANDETNYLGRNSTGQEIIRIRSAIYEEGTNTSWATNLDLSGVQTGFQGIAPFSQGYYGPPNFPNALSTNPSNNFLSWRTSSMVDAQSTPAGQPGSDGDREGGYYCGTQLSAIEVKDVNLTTYRDVSNNTNYRGYRAVIWQELRENSSTWIAYPTQSGTQTTGWRSTFYTATRPTDDIILLTGSSDTYFKLKDGYDGGSSYTPGHNKFKFGTQTTPGGLDPSGNFFGLPILAKTSTDIIDYKITLDNIDSNWYPTNNKLLGDFKLYFKGSGIGNAPLATNYINWKSQVVNKPWNQASSGGFPNLPSGSNGGAHSLTGNFDFDGTTTTSWNSDTNKYSRNLMPIGYTPSVSNPLFFIEGNYDNNLLRTNRNIGSGLETGARRTIDISYTTLNNENRFEGKGVGPNGVKTLFWDHTFNSSVTFQNVGQTGSSPYNVYPFVSISSGGLHVACVNTFDHKNILSGTSGHKQIIWSGGLPSGSGGTGSGFKHGGWGANAGGPSEENPYINYTNKYWFGEHSSTLTVDYSTFDVSGERLDSSIVAYNENQDSPWWNEDDDVEGNFNIDDGPYKVLVLKATKPTGFANTKQPLVRLQLVLDGTTKTWPDLTQTQAKNGTTPLVWFLEDKGNYTPASTFPAYTSGGYTQDRTGWRATHFRENTQGTNSALMNRNNEGCLCDTLFTNQSDALLKKMYMLTGTKSRTYDIYFRILIPNGNNSTNRLSSVNIGFYEYDPSNPSSAPTTVGSAIIKNFVL